MKKYFQMAIEYTNNVDEDKIFEISYLNNIKCSFFEDKERDKKFFFLYDEDETLLNDKFLIIKDSFKIKEKFTKKIFEKNYLKRYLTNYKSFKVGNFNIIPYFHKRKKIFKKGINIILNPGYSFGTGEHPTTKIVLYLMKYLDFKDKNVLDCGTGSGILSIAASKLKSKKVYAFDIDESTKVSTKENFKLNNIKNVIYRYGDINVLSKNTKFDIILVNMLPEEFKTFFEVLKNRLKKGGKIIVSGILYNNKDTIIEYFSKLSYSVLNQKIVKEWIGFILK